MVFHIIRHHLENNTVFGQTIVSYTRNWINNQLMKDLRFNTLDSIQVGQYVRLRLFDSDFMKVLDTDAVIQRVKRLPKFTVAYVKYGHPDSRPIKIVPFDSNRIGLFKYGIELPMYIITNKFRAPMRLRLVQYTVLSRKPQTLVEECCRSLRRHYSTMELATLPLPDELKQILIS